MIRFITSKKFLISIIMILQISMLKGQYNVSIQLKNAINTQSLHFPVLTNKIYLSRSHQSIWFNHDLNHDLLKTAAAVFYAAPEYGLNVSDFHCEQLSEKNITNAIQNEFLDGFKPMLDVLITDAMLTYIAQIHYGKANKKFPLKSMDNLQFEGLKTDSILLLAVASLDFENIIKSVEPKFKGYQDLQKHTSLFAEKYNGNCNLINDEHFKNLALNLERWRWISDTSEPYLFINIPSYTLTYFNKNTMEDFKVIVGKPITKTPVLTSKLKFFTTSPNWVVPKSIIKKEIIPKAISNKAYFYNHHFLLLDVNGKNIYPSIDNLKKAADASSNYSVVQSPGNTNELGQIKFNFDNSFSVYLHDTPNRELFNESYRALSHGCIRVEHPEKLVELLMINEPKAKDLPEVLVALKQNKRKVVYLTNPISIIVTYLTAEIKNGNLISYKDLYNNDESLIQALQIPID